MSLNGFQLLRPRTVSDAVTLLSKHAPALTLAEPNTKLARGGVQILAGGTDLVPSMGQKLFEPDYVLDIRGIGELRGIRELPDGGVEIGALTTLTEVERSPLITDRFRVLHEAVKTVASPVIRNQATLGGNLCLDTRCLWYNQSLAWRKSCGFCIKKDGDLCHVAPGGTKCWAAFSADTPPALLCLGAEVEIAGPGGARRAAVSELYTNVGDGRIRLAKNEIVTRVFLPSASAGMRGAYLKLRMRGSIDYPLAGVAVAFHANGHIEHPRVALTAVNPAPLLVKGTDRLLGGKSTAAVAELAEQVADAAARTAKPLTTSALTPEYRREMIRVFTRRALLAALVENFQRRGR
ncbi:MAG TPA: FAD binding domain-containing protein [Terriglobales bacterium]|nr:FAD binding domain-containing protein [Terriglobales bacterium]